MHAQTVPVSGERSEGEHGDSNRGELDERDQFASNAAEEPLVHQVSAGVHRGAGHQQQQVPQSQAGQEQVRHRPHALHRQTRLHQGDISHQTHDNDDSVRSGDPDAREPDDVLALLSCGVPKYSGDIQTSAVLCVYNE